MLLSLAVLLSLLFVCGSAWFGRTVMAVALVEMLILVEIFSPKIVESSLGIISAGTLFYGVFFVGMNAYIERHGRASAHNVAWLAFAAAMSFIIMLQFLERIPGDDILPYASAASDSFSVVPRAAFASMLAYLLVVHFHVCFYGILRDRYSKISLWSRHLTSIMVSQVLDSVIFFTLSFMGAVSISALFAIMLTGLMLKVSIAIVAVPALYASVRAQEVSV